MSIIGKTLAHYEIISPLGRGGMGEVYQAKDKKLGRRVAIKVLPREFAQDAARVERFQREAKMLASLNHPNIAVIHGLEECEGARFLVLELVEGETLADRIQRGPIPVEESLKVALQVSEALEAAHEKGVIHRDLKPTNIMITTEGKLKVLDFGLAKAIGGRSGEAYGSDSSSLSTATPETGVILGTPAYMSPEQARGATADNRSDIWSFGVVLYEMLTARKPFSGKSVADTLAAVISAEIDWDTLPEDTSAGISMLLLRCLTRERKERLQAIGEARIVIKECLSDAAGRAGHETGSAAAPRRKHIKPAWRVPLKLVLAALFLILVGFALWHYRNAYAPENSGQGLEQERWQSSIAVLPFVNMSSDREQEYFCDGLTEEMITRLSQLGGLRVTARTSAFAFKGENRDIREVGKKLAVEKILEGSVRKEGSRLRIAAQLVNVSDGFHLWSETYDRDLDNVFDIQDEIATSVARSLKLKLFVERRRAAQTSNVDAYNEFLRGRYYYSNPTKENTERAIEHYQRAIDLDSGYAKAWAALAATQATQASFGYVPIEEGYSRALTSVDRALALDADTASAHAVLGWIQMTYKWDWVGAEASFQRALELESGEGRLEAAQLALVLGRFERALALSRQAVELDALNDAANMTLALTAYYAGRAEEAANYFRRVLELNPDRANAHVLLGEVLLAQSNLKGALAEVEKEKDPYWGLPGLALVYHALGREDESEAVLQRYISDHKNTGAYQVAQIYAFRGETDRAFEWLEIAYVQHDGGLFLTKTNPLLKKLRHDPRFTAFLMKMNLPLESR